MISPEAVINIFCAGFFIILIYAFLRIVMSARKPKAGYVTSQEWTPEPKPIHAPGKWEQPSKPWPIYIEDDKNA